MAHVSHVLPDGRMLLDDVVSPPRVREAAARLDAAELATMERDDERAQLRYAADGPASVP